MVLQINTQAACYSDDGGAALQIVSRDSTVSTLLSRSRSVNVASNALSSYRRPLAALGRTARTTVASITHILCFYRLHRWEHKVSNARLLLYVPLAYAVAGKWQPMTWCLNALAITGVVAFQGALNDYWDAVLSHEANFLGSRLCAGAVTNTAALWRILAPLLLTLPLLVSGHWFGFSGAVQGLVLLGVGLAIGYSTPPLRLKTHRPWGLFMAPALTTLMFLESFLVCAPLTAFALRLAVLLALFQSYAEVLHVVRESVLGGSLSKCSLAVAKSWLRWSQFASLLCGLCFAWRYPVFLLSAACSTIRWWAASRSVPELLVANRSRWFSPYLCLQEFVGYGLIMVLRPGMG